MTGCLPEPMGRNTSARRTTPSSIVIGVSQSTRMLCLILRPQWLRHCLSFRERSRECWRNRSRGAHWASHGCKRQPINARPVQVIEVRPGPTNELRPITPGPSLASPGSKRKGPALGGAGPGKQAAFVLRLVRRARAGFGRHKQTIWYITGTQVVAAYSSLANDEKTRRWLGSVSG